MIFNKKHVGLVVAIEVESVLEKYGKPVKSEKIDAYTVLTYNIGKNTLLHVINCGPGEISAAAGTQFLISRLNCSLIVNFGVVGGLTKEMSEIKTCVVEKIVHYDFNTTAVHKDYSIGQYNGFKDEFIPATQGLVETACDIDPSLKKIVIASGDTFVGTAKEKSELHTKFKADVCDMESAGIALTCIKNNVPFLMIKCVSDGVNANKDVFLENFTKSANTCFDITSKIIHNIVHNTTIG